MYNSRKTYSVDMALSKLQKYCSYQDRCHKEVFQKLKEMRMIPEASEKIIAALVDGNYLNEERFAMAFVRGKFKIKKWGKRRLKSELKQRNISNYLLCKSLKQIKDEEYNATFEALANRKAASLSGTLPIKKKKLADYLLYRGWESQKVYDRINKLF